MDLTDLIGPDDVIVQLRASCKKNLLSELAEVASQKTGIACRKIFETLLDRERLGSTGIGNGIAIPHGKLPELDGITGLIAVLQDPIEFESVDDKPIDIVFLLLANDEAGAEHLKVLARIARVLRDPALTNQLREAKSAQAIYALLENNKTANVA